MKRIICVITIFFLILMLFLPPFLRRYANFDLTVVETKGKNDIISALNCKRINDSINISYLNNEPYNIQYKISGNYEKIENDEDISNDIILSLSNYANIKYNVKKNQTVYKLEVEKITNKELFKNYLLPINDASNYYQNIGFNCSAMTL